MEDGGPSKNSSEDDSKSTKRQLLERMAEVLAKINQKKLEAIQQQQHKQQKSKAATNPAPKHGPQSTHQVPVSSQPAPTQAPPRPASAIYGPLPFASGPVSGPSSQRKRRRPVCEKFLEGACFDPKCPFEHVYRGEVVPSVNKRPAHSRKVQHVGDVRKTVGTAPQKGALPFRLHEPDEQDEDSPSDVLPNFMHGDDDDDDDDNAEEEQEDNQIADEEDHNKT